MNLNLDPNKRYIEFGGGANPRVRAGIDVRVDTRPCTLPDGSSAVDFIVDMEKPFRDEYNQAISTGEFDGAISIYSLEHISWRVVPQFLSEVYRVLKAGGDLWLLIPNTQAQMEHLLRTQDWDDAGSMLFGGQDYGENAHKAAFTPEYITKLLRLAGFGEIVISPFGLKQTDMIVRARKTDAPTPHHQEIIHDHGPVHDPDPAGEIPSDVTPDYVANVMAQVGKAAEEVRQEISQRWESLVDDADGLWRTTPTPLQIERHQKFKRAYWEGGVVGGYGMYWDFPCHELTARHVLDRRPQSVLELGCARGYVLHRLQAAGVIAVGWDFSQNAYLARVSPSVHYNDVTDQGAWDLIKDGTYDLCFSIGLLDHIPESLLEVVFRNMARVSRRGLHGVNFGPVQDDCRVIGRPKEWWQSVLPKGHEVVNKDELEAGTLPESYYRGDGKVKLNLGSGGTMFHHGWLNVDDGPLEQFAQQHRYNYQRHDLSEGLPFGTESADMLYHSHLLQRLTYSEGRELLRECRRVMKPSGVMRVIVPDGELLMTAYNSRSEYFKSLNQLSATVENAPTDAAKLYALLCESHKSIYDYYTLRRELTDAGFEPLRTVLGESALVRGHPEDAITNSRQILRETFDALAPVSLFFEAVVKVK